MSRSPGALIIQLVLVLFVLLVGQLFQLVGIFRKSAARASFGRALWPFATVPSLGRTRIRSRSNSANPPSTVDAGFGGAGKRKASCTRLDFEAVVVLESSNPLHLFLPVFPLAGGAAKIEISVEGQDHLTDETEFTTASCTSALHLFLLLDKPEEPGVPQAFLCPAAPVIVPRQRVVGIVFHQASLPCGLQRYISKCHLGKLSARYFSW
jgi:hypothetical protein